MRVRLRCRGGNTPWFVIESVFGPRPGLRCSGTLELRRRLVDELGAPDAKAVPAIQALGELTNQFREEGSVDLEFEEG